MADLQPRYLTKQEVIAGLRRAGFSEDVIPLMTAIAGGESSYNTNAYNPRGADNSYGLLQINMEGPLGPARRRQFNLQRNEDLLDPDTNFRAAKAIYDSQGLSAWGAYTDGGYKRFLDDSNSEYERFNSQPIPSQKTSSKPSEKPEQTPSQPSFAGIQPSNTKVESKPKTTPKSQPDQNIFRNLMGSVIQNVLSGSSLNSGPSAADEYRRAAAELSFSEDPQDQELARKYRLKAAEVPTKQLQPSFDPVASLGSLFNR